MESYEKKLDEKKSKKRLDFFKYFAIPSPQWNGRNFVTSRQFLKAYKKFQCSDKGYICVDDVGAFLNVLFLEAETNEGVGFHEIKKFQRDFSFYIEGRKEYWISMKLLFNNLPMIELNFLKFFRGRISYTASDFMKIWQFYDVGLKGYLNRDDLAVFVFDLLMDADQKFSPKIHALIAEKLMALSDSQDGYIKFENFKKIIKVDKNFMAQFKNLSDLSPTDVDRIFAYYDPDDNGTLGILELDALMGDLADKEGRHGDIPYVIQKRNDYLTRIGVNQENGEVMKNQLKLITVEQISSEA